MTITVTDIEAGPFPATGAAQVLPFAFKALSDDEVEVIAATAAGEVVVAPSSYSVARNTEIDGSSAEGGSVTITYDAGVDLYVRAKPHARQEQVWSDTGGRLRNLNDALDRAHLLGLRTASDLQQAIAEAGSAIGLAGKADKDALADPLIGPASVGFKQSGDDAVDQTILDALRDAAVFIDQFRLVIDADDTASLERAVAAHRRVRLKARVYTIDTTEIFSAAGVAILGDSRYETVIQPPPGANDGRSILKIAASPPTGSSYGHIVANIRFRTNAQNVVMVDLDRVNNAKVIDCRFEGGAERPGPGDAYGIGLRFSATISGGSYSNEARGCDFTALSKGVEYAPGANANMVTGCEIVACDIGIDAAPGPDGLGYYLDTPTVTGGRVEGCRIGVKDDAAYGYYRTRFEANVENDILLGSHSVRPLVPSFHTATTPTPIGGDPFAAGLTVLGGNAGNYEIETSASRPYWRRGRQVFMGLGTTSMPALGSYLGEAAYFHDFAMMRNGVALEFVDSLGGNTVIGPTISGDTVTISGFIRRVGSYGNVDIGGGVRVAALTDNGTDLGAAGRRWKDIYAANATINTSDRRLKTEIDELDDAELRVATRLKGLVRRFRWRDAVAEKGDRARLHIGVIAQDVIAAFEAEGLDPFRYGIIVHTEWDAEGELWSEPVMAEDGSVIHEPVLLRPAVEAGDAFSIRYEELLAFIVAAL